MNKGLALLLSAALLLTAAGCSGGGDIMAYKPLDDGKSGFGIKEPPIKLRVAWWGGQARHDYTLKVIELYQQYHPNVTIETEFAAYDDYWKRLAQQTAANDLPDLIQMDISYLSQYGGKGLLEDLRPYIADNLIDVSAIAPNTLNSGQFRGSLYQMTLGVNALGVTADSELVRKAGASMPSKNWTWDDMEKLGQKLKSKGKLLADYLRYEVFFHYYLRSVGEKLYAVDGASLGYKDDKPFIDYFKRYQTMYEAGYFLSLDKLAQKKATPEDDEMVLGNSFGSFSWSNLYVSWSAAAKRPTELIPAPSPDNKKGLFLKASMGFSITKSSKKKEEAAKFINFFVNDIEANKMINGERGIPVSFKVKEALRPTLRPEEMKVFDYIAWAETNSSPPDPPNPVGAVEVERILKDLSEQILYKKITVEEAAVKFRARANAILAKNK